MPDQRKHRGRHPADASLFATEQVPSLQAAVADLSWLLTRDYNVTSALKLVGDRYKLRLRQRKAVRAAACSDQAQRDRLAKRYAMNSISGSVAVDGLNAIILLETALSGGQLFRGRDSALRDLSSIHGTYRLVSETPRAAVLLGEALASRNVDQTRWYLDRPVSNSGRLAALLWQLAQERGWDWEVMLVDSPDRELSQTHPLVVTSDGLILDRCVGWCDPISEIVEDLANARVLDLSRN